jgi:hypothetical protein
VRHAIIRIPKLKSLALFRENELDGRVRQNLHEYGSILSRKQSIMSKL